MMEERGIEEERRAHLRDSDEEEEAEKGGREVELNKLRRFEGLQLLDHTRLPIDGKVNARASDVTTHRAIH